jgi:hypothetical protein
MSKLVVRKLACVDKSNEIGSNDVYMAVFRGSFTLPPNIYVIGGTGTVWANLSTGDIREYDMILENIYQPENIQVIVLMEQDVNKDLLVFSEDLAKATEYWANNWMKFSSAPGYEACAITALAIADPIWNDDILGTRYIPPIHTLNGTGVLLEFKSDDSEYRIRVVTRP